MIRALLPVATLLVSVVLVMLGHGLQSTIIPLRAELETFSAFAIGAAASGYSVGFVFGCLAAPYAIQRAGHIRAFAAIISLASAAALFHILMVEPRPWILFRAVTGFCIAGFYIVIESWLNDRANNQNRGLVLSAYIVLLSSAFVVGQFAVAFVDVGSFRPFVIASILVSFAVVPIALTRSTQPAPVTLVRLRPRRLYRASPGAFVAVFLIGCATGGLLSLAPIYATRIGYSPQFAAVFSAALFAGGALLQWPLGRSSDFIDRRIMLIVCALGAIAASLLMGFAAAWGPVALLLLGALVGGFSQPSYSIASAHAFDHVAPEDYVETSSGVLLLYGIGGAIGPVVAASLMQAVGPESLFWFVAAIEAALALFMLTRIRSRAAVPTEQKEVFDYASTAPIVAVGQGEAWEASTEVLPAEAGAARDSRPAADGPA